MQQWHACAQTPSQLIARQRKRVGLGEPRRAQARAHQRLLEIERFVQIWPCLSQRRQPTIEDCNLLLEGRHRRGF